jgi:inward rectifier potassium channel
MNDDAALECGNGGRYCPAMDDFEPVPNPREARREARVETRAPSTVSQAILEGEMRVRALGLPRALWADFYHRAIRTRWRWLFAIFAAGFLAFNLLFAGLYRLDQSGLSIPSEAGGVSPFWRDFFFSVHTVATIGYGNVYPVSVYDNVLVVVEIMLGLLLFALATGIAFARFSRPTARMAFSHVMVVREFEGVPTLMLRAANQRHNLIFEASATVSLLADEMVEGVRMRRFHDLKLVRDANPVFTLTWTIMHPIDEDSLLHQWLDSRDPPDGFEIIVVLSGVDERTGHTIHGRWGYTPGDLRWNARFVDILGKDEKGIRTVDYGHFDDVRELAPGSAHVEARASTYARARAWTSPGERPGT